MSRTLFRKKIIGFSVPAGEWRRLLMALKPSIFRMIRRPDAAG